MIFNGMVYPFGYIPSDELAKNNFFADPRRHVSIIRSLKKLMLDETGNDFIGQERQGKCVSHIQIHREHLLSDLQEYASALDSTNLESIYMGAEQTQFNHLIEIRNNMGIFLPVFFFFPLKISVPDRILPMFIGSAVKLKQELKAINKSLQVDAVLHLSKMPDFLIADEEAVEDYESAFEDIDQFWVGFTYVLLNRLVEKSLEYKCPIFIC